MVIIGFDPGLGHTGYAVLNKTGNDINLIECGLVSPKKNKSIILFDAAYEAFIRDDDLPHSIYEIEGARDCFVPSIINPM